MSFVWPTMLLALLVVPVLAVGYFKLSQRRTRRQSELGTMGQLRTRSGKPVGRRRHVPAVVFLSALVVLIVGLARPRTTLQVSHSRGTVILAFDTSNSMIARDIKPSRIQAAQKAARTFVAAQPSTIRIGVVAFNTNGYVLQKPTRAKAAVLDAIARLSPGGGTSLGDAILTSLGAIAGKHLPIDTQALQAVSL